MSVPEVILLIGKSPKFTGSYVCTIGRMGDLFDTNLYQHKTTLQIEFPNCLNIQTAFCKLVGSAQKYLSGGIERAVTIVCFELEWQILLVQINRCILMID